MPFIRPMATRSFQQQAAVGLSFSARNCAAASKPPCLVRGPGHVDDDGTPGQLAADRQGQPGYEIARQRAERTAEHDHEAIGE